MKRYLRERQTTRRQGKAMGIILTVGVHLGALALVSFTGLDYLDPPPPEKTFIMEIEPEELPEEPMELSKEQGEEPQGEEMDKEAPVEMINQSESPHESKVENKTPATKENRFGDVEVLKPQRKEEPKLDPRASFPGMSRKDTSTTAPHSAAQSSDKMTAGQVGGKANAHLEGRSASGRVLEPVYDVQEEGTVVVTITVDNNGSVVSAIPGAPGTTVNDKKLWNEARKAAMQTKFVPKADAPAEQQGTITYRFNLK